MKQFKANNYQQVLKSFEAEGMAHRLERVTETIREDEKKYFHVVAVAFRANPEGANNFVDVNVLQLHEVDYNRLVKGNSYMYHGINKLYVLHNPLEEADYHERVLVEAPKKPLTIEEAKAQAREELLAEIATSTLSTNAQVLEVLKDIRGNADIKQDKPVVELDNKQNAEEDKKTEKSGVIDISAIESASYNELRSFAKENSIALGGATKQVEVLPIVKAWVIKHNEAQ